MGVLEGIQREEDGRSEQADGAEEDGLPTLRYHWARDQTL